MHTPSFARRLDRHRLLALCALTLVTSVALHAQTFQVIHNFTNGSDGSAPYAGVTLDQAGNMYGTTSSGGLPAELAGTVYKVAKSGSNWVTTPLYDFGARLDGSGPLSRVVFGPDGALYGTTYDGGLHSSGSVFRLTPPPRPCQHIVCPWTKTILYSFTNGDDGARPYIGDLVFDAAGNIYGTTLGSDRCTIACGNVYKLTHTGDTWTENVLYTFSNGSNPQSGVIFDHAGNLYGTTKDGGANFTGSVYKLSPSGSGWTKQDVYSFSFLGDVDGQRPYGGVTFDAHGNLYGTTTIRGPQGGGTAFKLTPSAGGWTFTLLHAFAGDYGPFDTPTLDAQGNVYGTSYRTGLGQVFKLTPSSGGWIFADLHDFTGPDGYYPIGSVALDAQGNLFGTTFYGGSGSCFNGCGVVWEITP